MNLLRPLLCSALLVLAGCESPGQREAAKPDALPQVSSVDGYLEVMNLLAWPDPDRQSELFHEVEQAYAQAPTTTNALRYALALVTPDYPAFDPIRGKKMLEQLLVNPEHLSAGERSLANLMIGTAAAWSKMQDENRRLAVAAGEHARVQANAELRAQMQAGEIAKLRKELDAAQRKLDAIISIERSIIERGSTPSETGKSIGDSPVPTPGTTSDR